MSQTLYTTLFLHLLRISRPESAKPEIPPGTKHRPKSQRACHPRRTRPLLSQRTLLPNPISPLPLVWPISAGWGRRWKSYWNLSQCRSSTRRSMPIQVFNRRGAFCFMALLDVARPCWHTPLQAYVSALFLVYLLTYSHALQELQVPFISISAPSIVSGMSGESEKTLRDTFEDAKVCMYSRTHDALGPILTPFHSQKHAPCLLFIDEIDAITPKRENAQREMERRIVAQFLTCMDGVLCSQYHLCSCADISLLDVISDLAWDRTEGKVVVLIGATNRPDSLDTALRRAGRFDHEICMNVPDEEGRAQYVGRFSSPTFL